MTTQSTSEKARVDAAYAAHRREQVLRWAQVPFAQKLQWLEEAHHLALHFEQARAGRKQNRTMEETSQVLEGTINREE